jgi:hypothetical protein
MGYSKFGNSKTKSKNGKGLRQSQRFTKRNKNKKPRNLKKEPFYGGVVGGDSSNINTPLSESIDKPNDVKNTVPMIEPDVKQQPMPMPEVKQEHQSEPEPEPELDVEVKQEQEQEQNYVHEPEVEQEPVPEPEVKQEQEQEQEQEPVPEPEVKQEQEQEQEQEHVLDVEVKQEQEQEHVLDVEVKQEQEQEQEHVLDVEVKQEQEQEQNYVHEPEVEQEPVPEPEVKQSNMKIESINPYKNEEELLNSNVTTEPETQNINNVQPSVMPVPIIPESNNKAIDLNSIVDLIVDVIADKILKKINTSNNLDKTSAEKLNTTLTAIESRSKDISQQGAGHKKTIKKKKLKYVYNPRTKTLRRKR